jgi:hypothetical protein
VCWRYLLAALLVLAATCGYMLIPRPDPLAPWNKYQQVKTGMTGPQVEEILGPPQQVNELFDDFQAWLWRVGPYTVGVALDKKDPPTVLTKRFTEKAVSPPP